MKIKFIFVFFFLFSSAVHAQILDEKLSFTADLNLTIPFNPADYSFLKKSNFNNDPDKIYGDENEALLRKIVLEAPQTPGVLVACMQFFIVKGYYQLLLSTGQDGRDADVCLSENKDLDRGERVRFKDDPPDTLCKLSLQSGLKSAWGGINRKAGDVPLVAEGVKLAEQMIRENPEGNAQSYIALGFVNMISGKFEEARRIMEIGLQFTSLRDELAVPFATMLAFEARETRGPVPIAKILELLEPNYQKKLLSERYYMAMARVYYLSGRYEEALKILKEIKSDDAGGALNLNLALALAYSHLGKNQDSLKALLKAQKLSPDSSKTADILWALQAIQ